MPEIQQTDPQPDSPSKADQNPLNTAIALYKRLPIGLQRLALIALGGFLVIVGIAVFHPSLNERWKFGTDMTLNLLILFAIAVQAYIYTRQRDVMQQQAQHMDGQLTAMLDAADKAKGQLVAMQHQEEVLFASQRAYITAKVRNTGSGSHQWRLRIENSGNTPANNVRVYYAAEMRDSPPWSQFNKPFTELPDKQIVFDTALHRSERLGVVAPNKSYHVIRTPKQSALSPEDKKRWIAQDLMFFVWGVIVYEDIFGNERQTFFCLYESQRHPEGYPCEHGNEAR